MKTGQGGEEMPIDVQALNPRHVGPVEPNEDKMTTADTTIQKEYSVNAPGRTARPADASITAPWNMVAAGEEQSQ